MYIGLIFEIYAEDTENNKLISDLLLKSYNEMLELIKRKMDILKEIQRVEKNY